MHPLSERLGGFFGRPRTIRFRIVTLSALILLPILPLFIWLMLSLAATQQALIERERLDVTNQLSAAIDRDIANKLGVLKGLAAVARQADRGPANLLSEVHSHSDFVRIWTFDRSGAAVGKIGELADPTLPSVESPLAEATFAGESAVSSVRGEGIDNTTVLLTVPILDGYKVVYGLAGEIRVAHLSDLFDTVGMNPTWTAGVVDRNGRFVARSINARTRVGEMARPELRNSANASTPYGTFENVTLEGRRVLNAYRRSALTGWTSVVAVPKQDLAAPLRSAMMGTVVGTSAVLAFTLLAMMWMANRISLPVRSLGQYARNLAGGKPYNKPAFGIVELDEVRAALESAVAKSAHLAAIVTSSGDAILSTDPEGNIRTWNNAAERLFGYAAEEVIGKPKAVIIPADRLEEFAEQRKKVSGGQSVQCETVRLRRDGASIDVLINAAPVYAADGSVTAMSSVIHDISALKAAEQHRIVLLRELAHRSKNQLAVIQSIAGQTGRSADSIDDFLIKFRERLQGMAVSHDLLAGQNWRGANLEDIVIGQLKTFVGHSSDQVTLAGPCVSIKASAAEMIGLALHELATNSVKYGALSSPGGRITINWSVDFDAASPMLSLEWVETGGPTIRQPPVRKGFGTRMIESLVASAVSGRSDLQYRQTGVYWRLECTDVLNKSLADAPSA